METYTHTHISFSSRITLVRENHQLHVKKRLNHFRVFQVLKANHYQVDCENPALALNMNMPWSVSASQKVKNSIHIINYPEWLTGHTHHPEWNYIQGPPTLTRRRMVQPIDSADWPMRTGTFPFKFKDSIYYLSVCWICCLLWHLKERKKNSEDHRWWSKPQVLLSLCSVLFSKKGEALDRCYLTRTRCQKRGSPYK